jgi:hypothetical protein
MYDCTAFPFSTFSTVQSAEIWCVQAVSSDLHQHVRAAGMKKVCDTALESKNFIGIFYKILQNYLRHKSKRPPRRNRWAEKLAKIQRERDTENNDDYDQYDVT